ncbi:cytochrome P450 [Aspergillus varians]
MTREPQNLKAILSVKFADYSMGNRIKSFRPLLGHGIFTADGEDWARSRNMILPNFVKDQSRILSREEVATLEGRAPSYDELQDMKYLKYCINETLRLLPVVAASSRTSIRDTILPVGGGPDGRAPVFVPKGAIVAYSIYAMHRRQDLYGPDAEKFRPERWADLRPGWGYLPFNGGPRICVGQQYALTEAAYVTTRLAQRYSVLKSRDPGPWVERLAVTMSSFNGAKASLRH